MTEELEDILYILSERQKRTSDRYYAPLGKRQSELVRAYYREQLQFAEGGHPLLVLRNRCGTIIGCGYERVVVGDYGAFIEMTPTQAAIRNFRPLHAGNPTGGNKYTWLLSNDDAETKVYYQKGTVKYADYKLDMYYVAPEDIVR